MTKPTTARARPRPKSQPRSAKIALLAARHVHELHEGLVRLEHAADAERADDDAERVENREHAAEARPAALAEPAIEIEHRAAGDAAVRILLAILHAERALGELRGHPERAGHPHPERGAGPTDRDRDRHVRDVADADRPRDRRRERLEVRHLTRFVRIGIRAAHEPQRVRETADVDQPQIAGEEDRARDQPQHDQLHVCAGDGYGDEDRLRERRRHRRERLVDRLVDCQGRPRPIPSRCRAPRRAGALALRAR